MNNDKELIKDILDHRNKNSNTNVHSNQSSSMKKMTLLNDSLNRNEEREQNDGLRKNCSSKNELLSRKDLLQKYMDNIKRSIENETKSNELKKKKRVNSRLSPSPLTSFCQSNIIKQKYRQNYCDHYQQKYEKYNMQELAYQIEKEFSKVNSTNESFNERLKFNVSKQKIKNEKINELVDLTKPHIEEKKKIATFNRLIQDANRRIEVKQRLENINSDILLMNAIRNNHKTRSSSVKINHEEWIKIYQDRFMSKLLDKNEKIQFKQKVIEQKKKEEEQKVEEEILKRKKVASKEEIDAITLRLHNHNYRLLHRKNIKDISICNQTTQALVNSTLLSKKNIFNKQRLKSNQIVIDNYSNKTNYQTPVEKIDENVISFNKAEKIINDFFIKQKEFKQ